MNNKRKLVITGVAVLVFFVGVAAFAAFPSVGKGAQSILAPGHIDYGGSPDNPIALPRLAPNHIDYSAPPDNPIALPRLAPNHIDYGALPDNQIALPNQASNNIPSQWIPGQEYIQGQQGRYISPQEYMQRYFSNQFSK